MRTIVHAVNANLVADADGYVTAVRREIQSVSATPVWKSDDIANVFLGYFPDLKKSQRFVWVEYEGSEGTYVDRSSSCDSKV